MPSERRDAEAAGDDSRLTLARALEGSDLGAWDWRVGSTTLTVSGRWREIAGVQAEAGAFPVERWIAAIHPEDAPAVTGAATALVEGRLERYDCTYRLRQPDGAWRWVQSRARAVVRDADGTVRRVAGTLEDVSERRRAGAERERTILDTSMDGFWLADLEGRLLEVNQAYCRMSGYEARELVGRHIDELVAAGSPGAVAARLARLVAHGSGRFESRHRRKDGTLFEVQVSVQCHPGEGGYLAGFIQDITERKRVEQERLGAEARFRAFFEAATEAMGISRRGTHVLVNPAYARLFGFEAPAALVGTPILDLIAPADRPQIAERVRSRAEGGDVPSSYEARARRRDGGEFLMQVRASSYLADGEVYTVVVLRDVTAARAQEAQLEERERRYRQLFHQVPVGVWEEDLSGVRAFLERLRAGGVTDLAAHFQAHPADAAACAGAVRILDVNDTAVEMLRAGSREELLASLDRVFVPEAQEEVIKGVLQLAEGRRSFLVESWNGTLDGGRRWVLVRGVLAAGHEATWSRVVVTTLDVSERREAREEKARLEERLRQAEKLEAVGRLAGGVAHDFNNLLSVILTCSAGLREDLAAGRPAGPEDAEEIHLAAERARDLTRQLLAFARKQVVAPVPLDLNDAVRGAEKLLRRVLGEAVVLEIRLAPGPLVTVIDPGQIEQVLVNLAINGRDAMPRGGRLTIETSSAATGPAEAGGPVSHPVGRWVRLRVGDDGPGLSPEVRAHLFEPFFTTKEVGKGTGLGLATVHGIVGQARGHIHAESGPGRGTVFEVCLPEVEQVAVAPRPAPAPAACGGDETILVVEDDALVRQAAARALGGAGYRVLVASGGSEALALAATLPPGALRLVVSDVIMPGPDGRMVVEELRRRHGPLRALYVSGYPQDVLGAGGELDPSIDLLQKPFTGELLRARVRAALDRP